MMLEYADSVAQGVVDVLARAPKDLQSQIGVIAFTLRFAEPDPRHQLLVVSADVGDPGADRDWRPSAYALPTLGVVGDPTTDPTRAAGWRALQERDESWDAAAGVAVRPGMPPAPATALEGIRTYYVGMLPYVARYTRRRLKRRAGWRGPWTMLAVTDFLWDDVYAMSQEVNDAPLPPSAKTYLTERSENRAGL
jgi:hypothetical protein